LDRATTHQLHLPEPAIGDNSAANNTAGQRAGKVSVPALAEVPQPKIRELRRIRPISDL
jgi:hypothetical protein